MDNLNGDHFSLDISDEVGLGVFSNLAIIVHSSTEFVLDFATVLPALKNAKVRSRVVMPPEHAKRLLLALKENIAKYENTYGPIILRDMVGSGEDSNGNTYMPPMGGFKGKA
ncbi:MAG: DUF3467 domain-containing protein [Bacteroidales bacterium]|nr:DUF3467 domain-containing protein [Bacteroidales bacterium]